MSDKPKDTDEAKKIYERVMAKFEDFNMKLAREEGYFIGVVNRPIFEVFPVTDEVKKMLDEDKDENDGKGLGSL